MHVLQALIHKLETGAGLRYLKHILLALTVLFLLVTYDLRCYKNMSAPEAMDAAQLARNIAEGRGYTTLFVRPLSIYLVKEAAHAESDPARLKVAHPDLANPPVYPLVLAGLMKVLPFQYTVDTKHSFWSEADSRVAAGRKSWRYQPDFLITVFNQVLFLATIILMFFWARWLFDSTVAWTSAFLLLGTEVLWRFSASGLSTMLLLLIFMGLIWCLTLWERETREPKWGQKVLLFLSFAAGAMVGLGSLTRYSFVWMIIPVLFFFLIFAGQRRTVSCLFLLVAFLVMLAPWVIRNYSVSGTPFGTATYSALEGTVVFPGFRLERSLEPSLPHVLMRPFWTKLAANLQPLLQGDLLKLGGGWIGAFFLVGLLVDFRSAALRRLRYFLVVSIGLLIVVQSLGRTQLSEESPEINSENLLVLVTPLVLVYGVSLFYLLLDLIKLRISQKYVIIGAFALLLCLPMIFTILTPRGSPLSYPPYDPETIQRTAGVMGENELMMSDIPWAVAWYSRRQCVWLTLNPTAGGVGPQWSESFFAVNNVLKPVCALYLTPETLDQKFLSKLFPVDEMTWDGFVMITLLKKEVPPDFPLRAMPPGYWPEQLFLADWARWRKAE